MPGAATEAEGATVAGAATEAGASHSRRARRKARRRARSPLRRWLVRGAVGVVILVVAIVAATVGYTGYQIGRIKKQVYSHVQPAKGPTENILLIGSTDRCAATSIKQFAAQCENGVDGINSDVVTVLRINGTTDKASLLSIPRDTFVPDARSGSELCGSTSPLTPDMCADKIDSALVEGPDQLVAAIEQDFGITINHVVDLNFATFEDVVNALGGLWMYFPDRLVDASSGLDIHHTGCIHLNGSEALELVRSRHMYYFTSGETPNLAAIDAANTANGPWYTPDSGGQYDGSGDLGRILRVHEFLKALASQVAARGIGDPQTDLALIAAVAPNLTVDSGLSTTAMLKLALDFRHIDLGTTPELTLPTITDNATYYYEGGDYGDVIFPSEPQDQQAIDQFLGTKPDAGSLATSSVSVSVIDGTDSPTTAEAVASHLAALGYRVIPTTDSDDVGPISETTVLYDGQAHLQQAERVMSSLAGAVVLGAGKPVGGADVTVIAGSLLSVAKPIALSSPPAGAKPAKRHATSSTSSPAGTSSSSPASSIPTTTIPATSTTLAIPTTTNPNIGAPTPANPTIPSYDPRECPKIP